jgi:toxin-antitoxin system PIN domain toxin
MKPGMISPDVNVVIAASRSDHPHHRTALAWLKQALAESDTNGGLEILPVVATGYLRLVTHPRVFREPTPLTDAISFLDALLAHAGVSMSELGVEEWNACRQLCLDKKLTANDVPDAFIAASARVLGARLTTFDRGFEALLPPSDLELLDPAR